MIGFFNDTATTKIYALSLHGALAIYRPLASHSDELLVPVKRHGLCMCASQPDRIGVAVAGADDGDVLRSEEHTSELQSRQYLVRRLPLEKIYATFYSRCAIPTVHIPL